MNTRDLLKNQIIYKIPDLVETINKLEHSISELKKENMFYKNQYMTQLSEKNKIKSDYNNLMTNYKILENNLKSMDKSHGSIDNLVDKDCLEITNKYERPNTNELLAQIQYINEFIRNIESKGLSEVKSNVQREKLVSHKKILIAQYMYNSMIYEKNMDVVCRKCI